QVVKVEEPDEDRAIRMMRGITATLEKHHGVRILEEAVANAVKLTHRYIPARQLPDKSVSLLDTASARVAIGQNSIPPAIEDSRRRIEHFQVELEILDREEATAGGHAERMAEVRGALAAERERLATLEARWEQERKSVEEIRALGQSIEARYAEEKA